MRNGFALPLSFGLLAAAPAMAHDTLPLQWCPIGSTVATVAQFELTPQALADYRALHLNDGQVLGSECNDLKTCGIVDDWFWANEAANAACTGHQLRTSQSLQAMPFVSDPATFNLDGDSDRNGIKDHHDQYRFRQGLKGVCVVCTPPTSPAPAEPVRAR
jgi:hypothetical protein